MGKASAEAKNRWNAKNYDRISVMAPKGEKAEFKAAANAAGMSVNAYILSAIREKIERGGIQYARSGAEQEAMSDTSDN